jgi:Flp pilus assembly protein protease CpaA
MGGLKAGDGKYLMAVGAMRGLSFLLAGAVYGALLGGVIALGFIAVRRLRSANGANASMGGVMKTWIPYGVALGLGTLVALAQELSGRLPGATL